jgi:hypothetical protein
MSTVVFSLFALLAGLTIHVDETVDDLIIVIVDGSGRVVGRTAAPNPGDYVFDDLADGTYTVRALVQDRVVAAVPEVVVPGTASVDIVVNLETTGETEEPQEAGARRNQNIQVNLVDNQALNEALGRQGAQVNPITEFSAVRGNYAVALGGIGRDPQIVRGDRQSAYHGEIYETHNNNVLNARTFFQVGSVLPSRKNQYGFRIGGPMGSDKLSFVWTGEETRESGFVNGNVRVPLASERTALAEDPELRTLIQSWLDLYPKEEPNRPEIDIRLLNTNAIQSVRNTGGTFRIDWEPNDRHQFSARYSLSDNFIDSFELVVGQNPNQKLRPQTLNLAWQQQLSSGTTLRLATNYIRRKVHILVPPGSAGPFVNPSREIQGLGPSFNLPITRVGNDFQYLAQGSTTTGRHQLDWGGQVILSQLNESQSDGGRGIFSFGNNFGRSAVENMRHGTATRLGIVLGGPYRAFRRRDVNVFVNDRIRLVPNLDLTLGLRYEFAGVPSEANDLTTFSYESDTNNFAPRIGLAYSRGETVIRAGYGISYGDVFPATFRLGRLNPPDLIRVDVQSPDLLNPLKDFVRTPGEIPRHQSNRLDADLVVPYIHQYTLQIEQELSANLRVRASYVGSRNWKVFRTVRENRAERLEGIELSTSTINERRPDQQFFSIARMTNQGRAYFDAGQLSVDKIFSRGLAVRATYTFSKALGTSTDFSNTGVARDEQRAQDESIALDDLKARSRFDSPHSFLLGYSYEFPGWMGGFTLSGTTIMRDGTPFTVENPDSPPFGNVDGERNDRPSILDPTLLGVSVDHPDTARETLPRDAFDAGVSFREGRGNLSRNTFRKDGTTNFNISLARSFSVSQDQTRSILFRTEFINAFNHPQFDRPTTGLADPNFGQITNTLNAGRIIQFHLRLAF